MTEETIQVKNKKLSSESSKNWRAKNIEYVRLYNREYRKTNAYLLYRKRYNKRHWQTNKERLKAKHNDWYIGAKCYINFGRRITHARAREELFHILGHICIRCGEFDKRLLQFDHINGGGTREHRITFHNRRGRFYQYYAHNPELAKQVLQVMCVSCNWLKRYKEKSL